MILNKTQNTIIAKKISFKKGFEKIRGLVGEKTPKEIALKTRFGIHTFLLKFPIDVIILDKNNKVVKLKKRMLPNRMFFWNIKFDNVVELPTNSIEKSKTEEGDLLEILL